jgi:tryptophan 2,3-dioxygenase
MDDSDAKILYGTILSGIKEKFEAPYPVPDESIARLALSVKDVFREYAKRDWRENTIVHRNIKAKLDDLLFDYIEKNDLSWELSMIDLIIEKILLTAFRIF